MKQGRTVVRSFALLVMAFFVLQCSGSSDFVYELPQQPSSKKKQVGPGHLVGRVTDSSMAGLPGVVLIVTSIKSNTEVSRLASDVSGAFSAALPAGNYLVAVSASEYYPVSDVAVAIASDRSSLVNIVLKEKPVTLSGELQGQVKNATDGQPLPGVSVTVHGSSGVEGSTLTDANGSYVLPNLNPGAITADFSLDGYIPLMGVPAVIVASQPTWLNETMTQVLQTGTMRIVLTWTGPKDGAVRDMDSYLSIPGDNSHFAIDFANRDDQNGANLDVDDMEWSGPETITISSMRSGTYNYYVNNFNVRCEPDALGNSDVLVRVFDASGLIKTYQVPQGTGITFDVFQIIDGQIYDVMKYDDGLQVEDEDQGSPNSSCEPSDAR